MDRFKSAKKASTLGIIGNVFLLIIKGIIGIITKSQAMIADSLNSAGDIFSSLMTYIGNKIASQPKDEDHNLGHGKAEYIFTINKYSYDFNISNNNKRWSAFINK